ncbi:precorrin-3B C(17)-methyltransferase [Fodinicurvata sp. EGI_FJ10296]|uniref:precorrin-3B C(17)-methyltransferase n=1 Tax=Fodinicurvata sp. EGI_FJ10296 TaxID=3231908 RepID=UPI0034552D7B
MTDDAEQPGAGQTGSVAIIGLGPGRDDWMTPETRAILDRATDLVGYIPYLDRAGQREGQRRHASDNRVELDRARFALDLALDGGAVAVVSGGDPGIFAMAAAIFEAIEGDTTGRWSEVPVSVHPGITAAQALAARAGAPLGNDFCVMSLSDNLKPWDLITRRLRLAAEGDFALALYNPISKARPWQLGAALDCLRAVKAGTTPVILGRDVGRDGETIRITDLAHAVAEDADMRTVIIIGASTTRVLNRPSGPAVAYTPRWHDGTVTDVAS